ncbi:MAG: peptidoglycan DD-metalloendopeptidase family protein [Candidatus Cloacimonetes bacterium]|nr:peptidoglycan DD-metalloendopeptidase family protein [Candidatus Cloacimonadota bacterium]
MAVKKRWYFTLTSTESAQARHFSVSKQIGTMTTVACILLILAIIGSLFYIHANQKKFVRLAQLETENAILKDRITTLSADVDSVLAKLRLMEDWEDQLRAKENLKEINKEIRKMGMGGLPQVDSTFVFIGEGFHRSYNDLLRKLALVKSKTRYDVITHEDVVQKLNLKTLLYRNTPSIYPTYGRISDKYGFRWHPITKKRSFHNGIDIANKTGTPIYATADGVVRSTGRKKLFGNYISLKHKFGYVTNYAHLDRALVKKGQTVKRGEIIGYMGNTGRSTGSHLHYEVVRYNKHRNPASYLNKLESDIILTK